MKIVVLSDTHLPSPGSQLPEEVYESIQSADLILHSGDIVQKRFYDELCALKEVRAVLGNMDSSELASFLPARRIEEIEGVRIGMIHGFGPPQGIETRVRTRFSPDDKLDVLIFGHSHVTLNNREGHLLLLNPGSPTDKLYAPCLSFAILTVEAGKAEAEIVRCS